MSCATLRRSVVVSITMLLVACSVGPDYQRPDLTSRTGPAWRQPLGGAVNDERTELARWWERLGSAELTELAQRLVAQNLSLAEARQRLVTARSRRGIVAAERLPQGSGGAGYTRAGTGDRGLNFQGPPPGQDVDVYSVSVTAGWELDLWGRVARLEQAADAEIEVAVADYQAAAVSLLAELAMAYVDANTLRQRGDVVGRNIALQQETVRLAQSRFEAGSGRRLDLDQAQRELETTRAQLPLLQQGLAAAENRLAVLVGERPRDALVTAADVLLLPAMLGLGVPADLLTRRADVRRSEQQLVAATALIGASEAERYPSLSIGGTLALRAQQIDTLGRGADALSYSFGPSLNLPLFTGGRLDAAVAVRRSEAESARWQFERTLLGAIAEVEDAATGVVRTRERIDRLEAAASAARQAVEQARQLYQVGSRGLLQLLDAQRAQIATEDALLLSRQAALVQTIDLYRALGGGFEPIGLDGSMRTTSEREPNR